MVTMWKCCRDCRGLDYCGLDRSSRVEERSADSLSRDYLRERCAWRVLLGVAISYEKSWLVLSSYILRLFIF